MPEIFKDIVTPFLNKRDSETWHVRAREALHLAELSPVTLWLLEKIACGREKIKDERLRVVVGGIEFENPVLVGAGWDKAGRAVEALHRMGFAGVEVGTVLEYPQEGNPKPRQWVFDNGAAMNRLGFNSPGADVVAGNLERYKGKSSLRIGISIGKNKGVLDEDAPEAHAQVTRVMYDYADYFTLNVSSPNTPGLRRLQDKVPLTDNVQAVIGAMQEKGRRKPLFVKIAPDLTETAVDDVIGVVVDNNLEGIVATNTTLSNQIKAKYRREGEMGGISGDDPDYRRMVLEKIEHIYKAAGDRIDVFGVGGIKDSETALSVIMRGASALQIVTAIRSEGPAVAENIKRGMLRFMDNNGVGNIREIRGIDVRS